jgi:hypothetical protein
MKSLLFLIFFVAFIHYQINCDKLKNGKYLVRHTSNNGAVDYQLTVNGKDCKIIINDTLSIKGTLNWIGQCLLKLEPQVIARQDTSSLGKKLYSSFGDPCFEVKQTKGDSTFFRETWTANLEITINEGYFLKVK